MYLTTEERQQLLDSIVSTEESHRHIIIGLKLSKNRGVQKPKQACPRCGKITDAGNMKQHQLNSKCNPENRVAG